MTIFLDLGPPVIPGTVVSELHLVLLIYIIAGPDWSSVHAKSSPRGPHLVPIIQQVS